MSDCVFHTRHPHSGDRHPLGVLLPSIEIQSQLIPQVHACQHGCPPPHSGVPDPMPTQATSTHTPPHQNQPLAEEWLQLMNTRAARAVFGISAAAAAAGSLLLAWAHTLGYTEAATSAVLWLCFAILSAGLYLLPPAAVARGGLTWFLAVGTTALLVNSALRTQGVQAVGLIFLPMLLLLAALLTRPLHALLLTLWSIAGLFVLYRGVDLGLWEADAPGPEAVVHLAGLLLSCAMALLVGLFAALRFAQAARLSAQHELRYRDLFDRIPSAVVLHDQGIVLDANRAALQIVGESQRDAFIGRDIREYVANDAQRDQFTCRIEDLFSDRAGRTLPVADVSMRRRDGHLTQVRATTTLVREVESDGIASLLAGALPARRPLFLSFMLDDTQRFIAQAETARVRALLEAVLSHSPYAFALSRRRDGRLVECNAALEKLVGRTRAQLLEQTAVDLGFWPTAEDRDRFIAAIEHHSGSVSEQVLRVRRADGEYRLVKGTGALLTFDGEQYVLMIGRDVTESLRREAEQQTVLQNAPVGVATTLGDRIVSANPRLHEIFGLPAGRMVGMRARELWADKLRHDLLERQVLEDLSQRGHTRFEQDFALPDRRIAVRCSGSVLPEEGRGCHTVLWITEDITQDRQTEQALQAAAQAAHAANRAKSAFLANMSHELRTPLNGILGLLDMALESDRGPEVQRHQVELARESSRVLADLLNDVLDLSKIEAGRLQIEAAPFELKALLESVRTVYEVLAESRSLRLRFEVDLGPGTSSWVRGDAGRVRQVLNNYLSNALKFTPRGEVVVRVARLPGEAARNIRLEVSDAGPGIPPAVQARLFQPFEQGDASAARRQGGTGLGLAICRELAALMGGRVGVESQVGQGSRFWAELPLPPSRAPTPSATAEPAEVQLNGLRVLVAEDNPVNMLITTAMLERAGARVSGVSNGQSALHAVLKADAEQDPFGLLLMDIQMPGMDGLQATQALRLTHPTERLPIIALTAGALQTERDAALQAGMDDFVTKPVDRANLLACAQRHGRSSGKPLAVC